LKDLGQMRKAMLLFGQYLERGTIAIEAMSADEQFRRYAKEKAAKVRFPSEPRPAFRQQSAEGAKRDESPKGVTDRQNDSPQSIF
jgi:hypothetical protein